MRFFLPRDAPHARPLPLGLAGDRPAPLNSGISSMHRSGGVHTIKTYLCNSLSVCPGTEECLSSHPLPTGPVHVGTVPGSGLVTDRPTGKYLNAR